MINVTRKDENYSNTTQAYVQEVQSQLLHFLLTLQAMIQVH